jgi:hypothetical protein
MPPSTTDRGGVGSRGWRRSIFTEVSAMSQLKFRVFRLDHPDAEPAYVGTFDGDNAKDAIRHGIYADKRGGEAIYEAHVLGNASVFDARSRIEQFIDSLKQLNTQQFFADHPPA